VSVVLANADGKKPGSLGRPLPGSRESFLARFDLGQWTFVRDASGRVVEAQPNELGVLLAKIEATPLAPVQGAPLSERPAAPVGLPRVLQGVLDRDDTWFVTGDLMRRDEDGDHWLVDRLSEVIVTRDGPVPSRPIEDALYRAREVALCAAYGVAEGPHQVPAAALVTRDGKPPSLDALRDALASQPAPGVYPHYLRHVDRIAMTDGYRPIKEALRAEPIQPDGRTWRYDFERGEYEPL
jgi:putative long chain acyl-CoA synthase